MTLTDPTTSRADGDREAPAAPGLQLRRERPLLPLLPMEGHTLGKRSAVTCHLKCADACFQPVPNTTDNPYFRDIASTVISRRTALLGAVAGSAAVAIGVNALTEATPAAATSLSATGSGRSWFGRLQFDPIAPVPAEVDQFVVPKGYEWSPIIRWGDPLFSRDDAFDPNAQTAEKQSRQFGYNNDYLDIIPADRRGTEALLVANQEYTNENIMFPPTTDPATLDEQRRIGMAAHGMSVVELRRRRRGQPWSYRVGASRNRRITASTPFTVTGPAAGAPSMRTVDDPTGTVVLGTLGNCAGGTTPWGTVLSGEENFNGYFRSAGTSAAEKRYGLADAATVRGWEQVDPRFDARTPGYENEPNRFGWIVEVDPFEPDEPPVKHTALGRFKHEGANVIVGRSRHVAAYMGDDERFDYLYKFVSSGRYSPLPFRSARRSNKRLLTKGSLYVAKFSGDSPVAEIDGSGRLPADGAFDGTGTWVPLVIDGVSQVPGFTAEQVLVQTRLAADAVGATKMDRCEDVEPSPVTGRVYVACTNNTDRGKVGKEGATEPNPRNANRDGHVLELIEDGDDVRATRFRWNVLLVCGSPSDPTTYFGGFPKDKVSPISCPDNLAFDSRGELWISTDGAPSTIGYCDGLFKVGLRGRERGRVQQFLSVPRNAETCGPVIHDDEEMVYVAVQHPGENGTWAAQQSYFPDYIAPGALERGKWGGPRPSVVQVHRG